MNISNKESQTIKVEIYSKPHCHLCDQAKAVLNRVREEVHFELIEIDITQRKNIFEKYKEEIPVIFINGRKAFKYRINEKELRKRLKHEI